MNCSKHTGPGFCRKDRGEMVLNQSDVGFPMWILLLG